MCLSRTCKLWSYRGLKRAVAAQTLATEKQAAAVVQAKIDDKVAEELKKVPPSDPPAQPQADSVQPEIKQIWDGDLS